MEKLPFCPLEPSRNCPRKCDLFLKSDQISLLLAERNGLSREEVLAFVRGLNTRSLNGLKAVNRKIFDEDGSTNNCLNYQNDKVNSFGRG
jgi:hypothetical protein